MSSASAHASAYRFYHGPVPSACLFSLTKKANTYLHEHTDGSTWKGKTVRLLGSIGAKIGYLTCSLLCLVETCALGVLALGVSMTNLATHGKSARLERWSFQLGGSTVHSILTCVSIFMSLGSRDATTEEDDDGISLASDLLSQALGFNLYAWQRGEAIETLLKQAGPAAVQRVHNLAFRRFCVQEKRRDNTLSEETLFDRFHAARSFILPKERRFWDQFRGNLPVSIDQWFEMLEEYPEILSQVRKTDLTNPQLAAESYGQYLRDYVERAKKRLEDSGDLGAFLPFSTPHWELEKITARVARLEEIKSGDHACPRLLFSSDQPHLRVEEAAREWEQLSANDKRLLEEGLVRGHLVLLKEHPSCDHRKLLGRFYAHLECLGIELHLGQLSQYY